MSLCPAKSFRISFTVLCDCKALQPLQLLVCVALVGFVRLHVETAGGERTKDADLLTPLRAGLVQVKRGV